MGGQGLQQEDQEGRKKMTREKIQGESAKTKGHWREQHGNLMKVEAS